MALSRITNYIEADGADLNLQSSDTTITDGSVLGVINFKAPSEASGTDAILLASKIEAVAEGTFSASSNATELVFHTASSEAAGTAGGGKLVMSSTGNLILKDTRTADGSSPSITLQTGDTDIAADDILGGVFFQAPDEATGTDAVLVAAGIVAASEGDFSSSSNATSLVFRTGASGTANDKFQVKSNGDLHLQSDGAKFLFGASKEVELTHVADTGLILKHTATGDDKPINLILQTGETDIAQNDVLGAIKFQAPDEGTGTDAILVAAQIHAVSEGDFSSSNNATSLAFATGASEAASVKMKLTSAGVLEVLTGGIDVEGGAVFNEDSADVDFRVESNGDANCLFVDGGNDEVGIGTNTPSSHSSPNGAKLVVNTSGATFLQLNGGSSSSVGVEFTDDAAAGQIHYFHGDNSLNFSAQGASSAMSVLSTGNVSIADGDLVVASGHGISFAATGNSSQDNSSGNFAELFADYEKGNFTATAIGSSGSAGSVAGNTGNWTYVKIGNCIHINGSVALTNLGSYSGNLRITGLPFTQGANNGYGLCITYHNFNSRNDASANIKASAAANQTYIQFGSPDTTAQQWSIMGTGYLALGGIYLDYG